MSWGTMEQRTEGMKKQANELIEQAYQRGYKAGYSKAENDYHANTEKDRQSSYELGLNMAWEAARKLVSAGYKECNEIFGDGVLSIETDDEIFVRCTASEAIEKLRAYKEQKESFINKPCVSEQTCHEDKMKVLEKIRAELERRGGNDEKSFCKSLNESYKLGLREAIEIIDKYMKESEEA